MGLCASSASTEHKLSNDQINDNVRQSSLQESQTSKLLLLGAGSSGKSTLFKQIVTIYGVGFNESERLKYANAVHNNILTSMQTICEYSGKFGEIKPELAAAKNRLEGNFKFDESITPEFAVQIKAVWDDPVIQTTYSHQNEYKLDDSAKYFFERVEQVSKPGYIPTEEDMLRSRIRTTGVVESSFSIGTNRFKIVDVKLHLIHIYHCIQFFCTNKFVSAYKSS